MNIKCVNLIIFNRENLNFASSTRAMAQVSVNDEFIIKSIRVCEGADGAYALMPSQFTDGEYRNIVFPITAEAREQILGEVVRTYNNMVAGGLDRLPFTPGTPAEHSNANIFVTLNRHNGKIKAVGQAVIDRCIVISGIKVLDYTEHDGREVRFVAMPSLMSKDGTYRDVVYPFSPAFAERLNRAVMDTYKRLQETEQCGLPYDVLRSGGEVVKISALNVSFARKLIAALDETGIAYSAQFNTSAQIYIKREDAELVNTIRRNLTKRLISA